MPDHVILQCKIARNAAKTERLNALDVGNDWRCILLRIALERGGGKRRGVDDGVVEDGDTGVLVDALDVFRCSEAETFIGLRHQVADKNPDSARLGDGLRNAADEQIGDEGCVEGARPDGDEIGPFDGVQCFGNSGSIGRVKGKFCNAQLAGRDVGFAAHRRSVGHVGDQGGVGGGDGVDASPRGKDLGGKLNRVPKVAGDFSESSDEEVAEVVAFQSVAGAKAVGEQLDQQILFFAEGDHAVAEVAGRQHVEVFAQASRGSTVIRDGYDGGEVADLTWLRAGQAGQRNVTAQAAQQRGQPCSAAHGDNPQSSRAVC